jgi:hypothetical protein
MSTAVECVREVFPASAIKTVRVENPLRVTIVVDVLGKSQTVWTCKQHNLFQRNPKRRRRAMDSIRECLANLEEQMSSSVFQRHEAAESSRKTNENTTIVELQVGRSLHYGTNSRSSSSSTLSSKEKMEPWSPGLSV